jgi:DNA-binding transcriptional regulator YhcF (GntR family)
MSCKRTGAPVAKRYEVLARELADAILHGAILPGERLPSVRLISLGRCVSPATVFQAYYRLEALGLVEARARSGYFVTPHVRHAPFAPPAAISANPRHATGAEALLCEVVGGGGGHRTSFPSA